MPSPRTIREKARVSQVEVAVRAKRSIPVVRLYEANPDAVSNESKAALDPIYDELARAAGG
ncbi:MAG TPA: hypothetical protein VK540_26795 [Polyangiaceae bacterium]|nr:hypothetical protein [Polyangiaceae bacterium]